MPDKTAAKDNELKIQQRNYLHGVTPEKILTVLREHYSWADLNRKVELNCFFSHLSIKSSLTVLRKYEWARKEVENLYLELVESQKAAGKDNEHNDQLPG